MTYQLFYVVQNDILSNCPIILLQQMSYQSDRVTFLRFGTAFYALPYKIGLSDLYL